MKAYLRQGQLNIQHRQTRFSAKLWATLFVLFGTLTLIALAQWQWQRAAEKQRIIDAYQLHWHQTPITLAAFTHDSDVNDFTPIEMHGHFDLSRTIWIENQRYQNRLGYRMVVPFITDQHQTILVNLGWLPRRIDHPGTLAHFVPQTPLTIRGHAHLIQHRPFYLSHPDAPLSPPIVVQALDIPKLAHQWHTPIQPFVLLIDEDAPFGYLKNWDHLLLTPHRHLGYVLQFMLLACLLPLIFIRSHLQRIKPPHDPLTTKSLLGIIFALFIVPWIMAYWLYQHHYVGRPTSRGHLLSPPLSLQSLHLKPCLHTHAKIPPHRWLVLYHHPQVCGAVCARRLKEMTQFWLASGKHRDRISLGLLAQKAQPAPTPPGAAQTFTLPHSRAGIMIADPHGDIVLTYDDDAWQKPAWKDLKHLLKWSQIG